MYFQLQCTIQYVRHTIAFNPYMCIFKHLWINNIFKIKTINVPNIVVIDLKLVYFKIIKSTYFYLK